MTGWVAEVGLLLLAIGFVASFGRLLRGPSLPDRVVALDLCALIMVGMLALQAVRSDVPAFLDVALVVGVVAFLATVAFARYVEKGS